MNEQVILFGAGTTGRVIARNLKAKGTPPLCFVDSNPAKHGQVMEGIEVVAKEVAKSCYPEATWVATAIVPSQWTEITTEIEKMGVKTLPQWGFLPQRNAPPLHNVAIELRRLVTHDVLSFRMVNDQIKMRNDPDHYIQETHSDIRNIYFEDFFTRLENEHFVDCGAADGDTVAEFLKRWEKWSYISAFEPDAENILRLREVCDSAANAAVWTYAVSDHESRAPFLATGDYSAHLGKVSEDCTAIVRTRTLDDCAFFAPPTFIKMDIESSEPEALWGSRRILAEHKPVLAVCAYHEADHLWKIPLHPTHCNQSTNCSTSGATRKERFGTGLVRCPSRKARMSNPSVQMI